jgi:hypothetical protein
MGITDNMWSTTRDSYSKGSSDQPFDNLLNFRDVGTTVNQFLGQK